MTQIKRFEDIDAWKKARVLVKEVYKVTAAGKFSKDFSLRDQIRRAAVSVVSNVAEGFSRQTDREFAQFLYVAKGSISELQSQFYVALDLGYLNQEEFDNLYGQAEEVVKLISGFIRYLKGASDS
jgi:four helix bundle protein